MTRMQTETKNMKLVYEVNIYGSMKYMKENLSKCLRLTSSQPFSWLKGLWRISSPGRNLMHEAPTCKVVISNVSKGQNYRWYC